jgi:hypothetical protein
MKLNLLPNGWFFEFHPWLDANVLVWSDFKISPPFMTKPMILVLFVPYFTNNSIGQVWRGMYRVHTSVGQFSLLHENCWFQLLNYSLRSKSIFFSILKL